MADFTSLCLPTSRYGTAMSCQKTFEAGACFFFLNKNQLFRPRPGRLCLGRVVFRYIRGARYFPRGHGGELREDLRGQGIFFRLSPFSMSAGLGVSVSIPLRSSGP